MGRDDQSLQNYTERGYDSYAELLVIIRCLRLSVYLMGQKTLQAMGTAIR